MAIYYDLYKGESNPEYEVMRKTGNHLKEVILLERKVIEQLDSDQREVFKEYSAAVREAVDQMGINAFEKGLQYGLRLMASAL